MNEPKNILEKNISDLFGFADMDDKEKLELLDSVGSTIMESAALRFIVSSDEETVVKFQEFLEAHKDDKEMLEELLKAFPPFGEVLEEEIAAFKSEAVSVLGDKEK